MTELRNRGIGDVLMVCCDSLKGLPDAARAAWPLVDVQLCVVHPCANRLRYASKKHWRQTTSHLRAIYTAPSTGPAEVSFEAFAQQWGPTYPAMVKAWRDAWDDFKPFLESPVELRTAATNPPLTTRIHTPRSRPGVRPCASLFLLRVALGECGP